MFPDIRLINQERNSIVIFEKEINNPINEGFISYWNIIDREKKLLFKRRLNKKIALLKLNELLQNGWVNNYEKNNAA
tara:strand:+ start:382 stop:612 length:231 start_codon:yes stop_codon:yes gene_type:complete